MPTIKITRNYTLPATRAREGRGRTETRTVHYYADDWRTPVEWATEELTDAGCTRHNWGARFMSEEPKITDHARDEHMDVTAELSDFTDDQRAEIITALERN